MIIYSIFTPAEFKEAYGSFYEKSPLVNFELKDVPQSLALLEPYAQFWGVSDDLERYNLVQKADEPILANLRFVIQAHEDQFDEWLAGPEAKSDNQSDAYIAFSALRMAADFA